jgi:hypothetical protein
MSNNDAYLDGRQDVVGGYSLSSIFSCKIIGTGGQINDKNATGAGKGGGRILADIGRGRQGVFEDSSHTCQRRLEFHSRGRTLVLLFVLLVGGVGGVGGGGGGFGGGDGDGGSGIGGLGRAHGGECLRRCCCCVLLCVVIAGFGLWRAWQLLPPRIWNKHPEVLKRGAKRGSKSKLPPNNLGLYSVLLSVADCSRNNLSPSRSDLTF